VDKRERDHWGADEFGPYISIKGLDNLTQTVAKGVRHEGDSYHEREIRWVIWGADIGKGLG